MVADKLEGVQKVQGEFRLFVRNPREDVVLMLDDRWRVTKLDETHYQVSPSLNYGNDFGDSFAFHTTNPFIIEIVETKLTSKRD